MPHAKECIQTCAGSGLCHCCMSRSMIKAPHHRAKTMPIPVCLRREGEGMNQLTITFDAAREAARTSNTGTPRADAFGTIIIPGPACHPSIPDLDSQHCYSARFTLHHVARMGLRSNRSEDPSHSCPCSIGWRLRPMRSANSFGHG